MKIRVLWIVATLGIVFGALSLAGGPRKTQALQNVQVLKGQSPEELMATMQAWTSQTGLDCSSCHVGGDFASDDNSKKVTARLMYKMVQTLNEQQFFQDGPRKADCYLCHKGNSKIPKTPVG